MAKDENGLTIGRATQMVDRPRNEQGNRDYLACLANDIGIYLKVGKDNGENTDRAWEVLEHFFEQTYNLRLDNVYGTQPIGYVKRVNHLLDMNNY